MSGMLLPKGRYTETSIPAVSDVQLHWLTRKLGPAERRALRMIVETADLVIVDDRPHLIVPALDDLIDTLAAFEAEGEDRENDLEDEPQPDDEPDPDEGDQDEDKEPDYHSVPDYGMDQSKPLSSRVG